MAKLITKIMIPVGGAALLGGGIGAGYGIYAGTHKQGYQPWIEAGENDITITGNEIYNTWRFSLKQPLTTGQTLSTDLEDDANFKFKAVAEYTGADNKIAKVYVLRNTETTTTKLTQKYQPTFTCKNPDGSVAWTQKIDKEISVTYAPFITLKEGTSKEIITNDLSADQKSMTFTYDFKLQEKLEKIQGKEFELNCWVTNLPKSPQAWEATNTKVTISNDTDVELEVTVNNHDSTISDGTYIEPYFQFECVLGETTWWQSDVMKGFKVHYESKEVTNTVDELSIVTIGGYKVLTGINATTERLAEINTLLIPENTVTYVGNWDSETSTYAPLTNITNIKKIKIGGLGVLGFWENAFNGCSNVKCLDVSSLPDTVKSLDKLTMGDNSFSGLASEGRIIWNDDFSQYKKHLLKEKLYKAGLTNSSWYGITKVETEDALREAASIGGYIQLQKDIEINKTNYLGQINFRNSSILDLNGYNVTTKKPIYNTAEGENAIFGIWGCEVVITDTSTVEKVAGRGLHGGGVYAYNQSGIEDSDKPASGESNDFWEWVESEGKHKPRETRCFYVRSDLPQSETAKGTLEILGGKFTGNCTCIFTYNTICYVEDAFSTDKTVGEYAPEFHINTPYFDTPKKPIKRPTREMFNCKEDTFRSEAAYFDFYGGKFFNLPWKASEDQKEPYFKKGYDIYDPEYAWGDSFYSDGKFINRETGEATTWDDKMCHPDFLNGYKDSETLAEYKYSTKLVDGDDPYVLVVEEKI